VICLGSSTIVQVCLILPIKATFLGAIPHIYYLVSNTSPYTSQLARTNSSFNFSVLLASLPFVINMEVVTDMKDHIDDLSSVFSRLHISVSRDSSYASDESSVDSGISPIPVTPNIDPQVPVAGILISRVPKSILKNPFVDADKSDTASESGYESYYSDSEFTEQLEFIPSPYDEIDDDLSADDTFDCTFVPDLYFGYDSSEFVVGLSDDQGDSDFDDSFITFANSVRFAPEICYIDAPGIYEDCAEPEMTVHEQVEMARVSHGPKLFHIGMRDFAPDVDGNSNGDDLEGIIDAQEEHPRDIIELDKQLFIAYMNGINGVASHKYKSRLQTRAQEIRQGLVHSPFSESETTRGAYLDHVLNHVIGVFRNLLAREEFMELVALCGKKSTMEQSNTLTHPTKTHPKELFSRIERLISERLACGNIELSEDELSFFAGGVVYAIENWNVYSQV